MFIEVYNVTYKRRELINLKYVTSCGPTYEGKYTWISLIGCENESMHITCTYEDFKTKLMSNNECVN